MRDEDLAYDYAQEAYEAADILAMILDRCSTDWGYEDPDDVKRARNIVRAALVSVVALVGGGASSSAIAARLARDIQQAPEICALRDALRRCEQVPERDLLALYNRATQKAA